MAGERITPKFRAEVVDGKLKFYNEIRFFEYLKKLNGFYYVGLEKIKKTRTDKQNRFYWAYLRILSEETGNEEETMHEYFKRVFLPPRFEKIKFGKKSGEIKLPATTTTLSKLEFGEYLTKIEAMTGISAPNPEEYFYQ